MEFVKLNEEPIEITYAQIDFEDEEIYDPMRPAFWWDNKRYLLEDFIRVHNNPWFGSQGFPEHIHGVYANSNWGAFCVELIGDSEVNVYVGKEDSGE